MKLLLPRFFSSLVDAVAGADTPEKLRNLLKTFSLMWSPSARLAQTLHAFHSG